MTRRRFVLQAAGGALAVLAGLFAQLPAEGQTATKTQQLPSTEWGFRHPGPGKYMDGMGTWLYVLPQEAAGPSQLSRDGYQYQVTFIFEQLRHGRIGVGTGPHNPVAQLEIEDVFAGGPKIVAEVAYDWSPGRFYFVYTQLLANGEVAGWIMDWETGVWTYIGSVDPPVDWGRMVSAGRTSVKWASGRAAPADCSGYPRTDAYFFPGLGYTGTAFEIGMFGHHHLEDGDCPARAEILDNGWVHYQLGV